jgi:hypothetical protein
MILHQFAPWISIEAQVLDGPPCGNTRRPSTFLLIPVGSHRQGFAYRRRIPGYIEAVLYARCHALSAVVLKPYLRGARISAAISAASLRLNGKFGIFGCGSSRKNATFPGVKSALRAMAAIAHGPASPAIATTLQRMTVVVADKIRHSRSFQTGHRFMLTRSSPRLFDMPQAGRVAAAP